MLGTDRPLFGDRDKTIHDDVMEISKERRKGYRWFSDRPSRALQEYHRWKAAHPLAAAYDPQPAFVVRGERSRFR